MQKEEKSEWKSWIPVALAASQILLSWGIISTKLEMIEKTFLRFDDNYQKHIETEQNYKLSNEKRFGKIEGQLPPAR